MNKVFQFAHDLTAAEANEALAEAMREHNAELSRAKERIEALEGQVQDLTEEVPDENEAKVIELLRDPDASLCAVVEEARDAAAQKYGYTSDEWETFNKLLKVLHA